MKYSQNFNHRRWSTVKEQGMGFHPIRMKSFEAWNKQKSSVFGVLFNLAPTKHS